MRTILFNQFQKWWFANYHFFVMRISQILNKLVNHRVRVPGTVEDFLGDNGGKVEDENG